MIESLHRVAAAVSREVRELARRRTPFVLRTAFAAIVGIVIVGGFATTMEERQPAGMLAVKTYYLFATTTWVQGYFVLVTSLVLGVASAQSERRNRTLGLLLLSRLRYWEIVVGKTVALFGLLMMILIVALPLFGIVGWAGGLDYAWLWRSALLSAVLALLGLTLGLCFGLWFRIALLAFLGALFGGIALLVLPQVAGALFGATAAVAVRPLSAGTALGAVASQGQAGAVFWRPVALTALAALALIPLGALALRRSAVAAAGRGVRGALERLDAGFEAINVGGLTLPVFRLGRPPRNPVAWMGRITAGLGHGRYTMRLLLVSLGLAMLLASGLAAEREWSIVGWAILWPALLLMPLHAGATAFASERAHKSLRVLLSTPLTPGQLVGGKLVAFLQRFALLALPPAALFFWVRWMRDPGRFDNDLIALAVVLAVESLGGFFIALGPSLVASSALRAGVGALGLMASGNLLPPVLALFVYSALTSVDTWAWVGVTVLALGAGGLAVLYLLRMRGRPGWDLAMAFGAVVVAAGTIGGMPIGREPLFLFLGRFAAANAPLLGDTEGPPLLYALYFAILAAFCCSYVIRRFERITERAR